VSTDKAVAPPLRVEVDVVRDVPVPLAMGVAAPVGAKVAVGLERQELAAALAAEEVVGAAGFTVPLPANEHAAGLRLLDS